MFLAENSRGEMQTKTRLLKRSETHCRKGACWFGRAGLCVKQMYDIVLASAELRNLAVRFINSPTAWPA